MCSVINLENENFVIVKMVVKTEKEIKLVHITSKRKLTTCSVTGITLLLLLIFLLFVDPVTWIVKWNMKATEGSKLHGYLKQEQDCMTVSAYLFNITNAERFMAGVDHKLKVEEVGPFTYVETRKNDDLEVDDKTQEVRYSPRVSLVFQPELSIGNPEDLNVTLPNLPMLGMTSIISSYPYWTRLAYNLLITQLKSSPVVTVSVHEYLWGYKEPLITLGNNLAPGIINFEKMGFLDRFYKNTTSRLILSASDEDKFMIKTRNGHKRLSLGHEDPNECAECDSFKDTYEGFLYPLPFTSDTKIRIFKEGLCKIVDMTYNETRILDNGAEGLVYNLSDSFFNVGSNDTHAGLVDFSACYFGAPVSFSKGHLLDVNPVLYYERLEGMKPDAEKHNSYCIVEPKMGIEVETYISIQSNMVLGDLSFNSKAGVFSNMLVPVGHMYLIQPELNEETMVFVRLIYVVAPIAMLCFKLILFLVALVLISYSVRLICWHSSCKKKIYVGSEQVKKSMILFAEEPLMGKTGDEKIL